MKTKLCGAALAVLMLAGCGNLMSINHSWRPDNGDSMSIDAKQRAVYSVLKSYGRGTDGKALVTWRAVCAEPSPDAITAISASSGLSAEQLGKAISAAFSAQESSASIGLRTQTIQILRDAMYRLCEGYASGALDEIGFNRLQRRYQSIMLGLLAIEQLTGAVVAKQAIIGTSAEASVARTLLDINKALESAKSTRRDAESAAGDAKSKMDAAAKDLADSNAKYAQLKKDNKDDANADPVKKFKAETLDPAQKKADEATKDHAALKKALDDATASVEALEKNRDNLGKIATRASGSGSLEGGGHTTTINPLTVATISSTVKEIVSEIVNKDYTRETCIDAFLSRESRLAESNDAYKLGMHLCVALLQAEIVKSEERLAAEPAGKQTDGLKESLKQSRSLINTLSNSIGNISTESAPKSTEKK